MTSKQQKSRATKKATPASTTELAAKPAVEKPKVKATPAPKPTKEKREAKAEQSLVVFAIRLSEPERQAIHEAAGPARATRFIRAVAIAAAHGDVDGFKRALKDAEEARAKSKK